MFFRRNSWLACLVALLAPSLVASAGATATPPAAVNGLDRILAVVNDDVITETELNARLAQTKQQLRAEKIALPADNLLRQQLLERVVMERIQLQLAERTGIRVSDAEVDRAIEGIAQKNKMNVAEFRRLLVKEGLDPQVHAAEIRSQLLIRQLLDREINSRVVVGDSEVASFLETHPQGTETEYNLSHIFLPLPETASPDTIQTTFQRADDILRRLKDGTSFEQLAVTYSQGEGAMNGGALGWKTGGQLPELFLTAIKDLPVGGASGALRGPNGFHILRLNARRGEGAAATVSQTHVRHILLRRNEIQSSDEVRSKLLQLRSRIEHGEDFATLANANSEDTGSAVGGGDLGWVNPGQLVPEFESAMDALKSGEVSQPVGSPFGLHLIQVLERRTQNVTEARTRTAAHQQIFARKASERYEQWLRQVRDEAYVEILSGEE